MKNIIFSLLIFISFKGFSQYPVPQTIGSDSALVTSKGGMKGRFINWVFTDTGQANLQRIRQYPGAQIFTSSDNGFWLRNAVASGWINTSAITAETDPIWSGVSANYRTFAQNNLLYAGISHVHSAADITSGVLAIIRGGTGLGTIGTSGQSLRVATGGTALEYYTPAGGGTTSYQTQTASGSTSFTFTSVPASTDDYIVFVNGAKIRQTTDYSVSGNVITIPTIILGDQVEFQRIK